MPEQRTAHVSEPGVPGRLATAVGQAGDHGLNGLLQCLVDGLRLRRLVGVPFVPREQSLLVDAVLVSGNVQQLYQLIKVDRLTEARWPESQEIHDRI